MKLVRNARLNAELLELRDTPAIFIVTTTADTGPVSLPNTPALVVTTTADSGPGSLRDAITNANALPGADVITFALPTTDPGFVDANGNHQFDGGDYWSIAPSSALPAITQTVNLNGWSQLGSADRLKPVIELNGTNAGTGADGLTLTDHAGSKIKGLAINRFGNNGITITGGGQHKIVGNFLGTDPSGTQKLGNTNTGLSITNSALNAVGGTVAQQRNLISGNNAQGILFSGSTSNSVLGNLVGSNISGDTAIANGSQQYYGDGVRIQGGGFNIIGGSTRKERNLISGNVDDGVDIRGNSVGNQVIGNFIGTNLSTHASLANGGSGVYIQDASQNLIGSLITGQWNVLSGNGYNGVFLYGDAHDNTVLGNFIGTNAFGDHVPNGTVASFADGIFLGQFTAPVGPSNNTIQQNIIAFNIDSAISVDVDLAANTVGNTFTQNQIFGNAHIAIDYASAGVLNPNDSADPDVGPNRLQNFPVLLTSTANPDGTRTVSGTLNSTPTRTFRIEFFASSAAKDAQVLLGSLDTTTLGDGTSPTFQLRFTPITGMQFITATATDLTTGDTSQLSAAVT